MKAVVSIYHDTRRQKADGTYPVKLRVYDGRNTRFYPTGMDLTEVDFAEVLEKPLPEGVKGKSKLDKKDKKTKRNTLEAKQVQARDIIEAMAAFSFPSFEKKLFRPVDAGTDVFYFYKRKIEELLENDQIKTAYIYQNASDSFRRFVVNGKSTLDKKKKDSKATAILREDESIKLSFKDVNEAFLKRYKNWMGKANISTTTLSMYLRTLRTIFNLAIKEEEITKDIYPFEEGTIPTGANVKQALEKDDLRKLRDFETTDPYIIKARDFWFFIFNAYGMNVRDVVQLKDSNINGNKISFRRQKTKNTTKKEVIIQVPITQYMQDVINKYKAPGKYIFGIIHDGMTEAEKVKASDAFVTFINDHMERLAKQCGVTASTSTYSARHSFGTMAIRNGAPMALIQESFGHQSLSTTQNYFAGFEDSEKWNVSNNLMNF